MRLVLLSLSVFILSGCGELFEPGKELEPKVQTLELHYVAWACDCPHWMFSGGLKSGSENIDCESDTLCLEIEPADTTLEIPDHYWSNPCGSRTFKFTGSFYRDKQKFPGNDRTIRARTFRYTGYEYVPSEEQKRNDWLYRIKDLEAFRLVYKLPIVKQYLARNNQAGGNLYHLDCPDKEASFYVYELERKAETGEQVTDETLRLDPATGIFERLNNRTGKFERLTEQVKTGE